MIEKLKEWMSSERLGRCEEGTSQDMFPTNGDMLLWWAIMIPIVIAVAFAVALLGGTNGR